MKYAWRSLIVVRCYAVHDDALRSADGSFAVSRSKSWWHATKNMAVERAKTNLLIDFSSYYAPVPRVGGIKRWCASDVCLYVAYIGPKSRTERPRKTKIGTEVAHITCDSGTTFKVKRSKVNLQGRGMLCRSPARLVTVSFKLSCL